MCVCEPYPSLPATGLRRHALQTQPLSPRSEACTSGTLGAPRQLPGHSVALPARAQLPSPACASALCALHHRLPQGKERSHLYLDGWAGSGKSVALYSLVAWARANGWLALYVPSAFSLVQSEPCCPVH